MKLSRSRRRLLLAAAAVTFVPIGAHPLGIDNISQDDPEAVVYNQIRPLIRQAMLDVSSGKILRAIVPLQKASAILDGSHERNWSLRRNVDLTYGLALLRLDRVKDAIPRLESALQTEQRMRTIKTQRMQMFIMGLDVGMFKQLSKVEFGRQAYSHVEKDGKGLAKSLRELLADESTGTMECSTLLLRAYAKDGQLKKARALLLPELEDASGPQEKKQIPPLALEYRLFKMGVSLSAAGDQEYAAKAFNAALGLNAYRMRIVGGAVPAVDIQMAIYGVRRNILSAYLGNADLRAGNASSTDMVECIIETKGLGVRYAEQLNSLLAQNRSSEFAQVRQKMKEIDDQMVSLPNTQAAVLDFLKLGLSRWLALSSVMPELQKAGLGNVYQDGKTLLQKGRTALGADVLIGYMAYTPLEAASAKFGKSRYVRYCVSATEVQVHDIGLKQDVDRLVFAWRQAVLGNETAIRLGQGLARQLLSDLPSTVAQSKRWVIDPDDALSLLPFEALADYQGLPLIESVEMRYVTAFAQLVTPRASSGHGPSRIVADPKFQSTTVPASGARTSPGRLAPLPETRKEASAVAHALQNMGLSVDTFMGEDANAQALEMRQPPRYLHIATHGVLFRPQDIPAAAGEDPLKQAEAIHIALPGRAAGIALSGADEPDIILAKDLAHLPLQGTELVVLSACDTGNGKAEAGEGVASLRRALEEAGAQASVTSLWAVPSVLTTQLMASFYRHIASGQGKAAALRQAKREMRVKHPNPYGWAAFVLAGRG